MSTSADSPGALRICFFQLSGEALQHLQRGATHLGHKRGTAGVRHKREAEQGWEGRGTREAQQG
eukprot:343042-Pelagomonas_calceolata.AAC.3